MLRLTWISSFSRRGAILLIGVIGIIALSWWSMKPHPSEAALRMEDYFSVGATRSGGSTDRLIAGLQERLRGDPSDWQSYSQLGLAYLQKARETGDPSYYQKTELALQRALALEPEDYAAVSAAGVLALARHQFAGALDWGERARQINPDRPYAYGVIADAQIELGRYEAAVATLQTMVDLRPDASAFTRISYLRELYGDKTGAVEMMQAAVDTGGANPENLAWTRTQLGNLFFNQGKLERAETEYRRALQVLPGYVYALAGMGRVYGAHGQTDRAIALLVEASETMPLPEFIIPLVDLYQLSGQTQAAREKQALLGLIQGLFQSSGVDMDLEIALYNADHRIDPEKTVEQARQAYLRRPGVFAADVLSWAYYQVGDYRKAQEYSQKALGLGTQDALKYFHAGMIQYRLGEFARARADLERALAINPHFSLTFAQQARQTLNIIQEAQDLKGP